MTYLFNYDLVEKTQKNRMMYGSIHGHKTSFFYNNLTHTV